MAVSFVASMKYTFSTKKLHTHERAYYSAKSNEMNGKLTSKNDRMAE